MLIGGAHMSGGGELSEVVTLDTNVKATVLSGSVVDTVERIFHVV